MIRKATSKDIDGITAIYNKVLDMEEQGAASIGWQRGVYPTRNTALMALERGDLFVYEEENKNEDANENANASQLMATAIINHLQMDSYAKGNWKVTATDDEVMVLHTLVVDPDHAGKGIGKKMVAYYEQYAKKQGCKDLRMDTQAKNQAARNLYHHLGYEEIGIVPCDFNGIPGISLVLLEKAL